MKKIRGRALAAFLNNRIDEMVSDDRSRSDIVDSIASAADISASTVNQILQGSIIRPPDNRLSGFARVLDVSTETLQDLADEDAGVERGGFMSRITAVIRSILSDSVSETTRAVERAIALDSWRGQIWHGVFEHDSQPEFDFWPHDIFFDNDEVFAVAVSNGSLFRFPVDTSDAENVVVGEPVEVVVDFIPTERTNYVKRGADGRYHGLAVLCSAAIDKDGEIDSRALFDTFTERFTGDEYVNVYHLGGEATAIGRFDYVARDGNLLIGHYILDDTPVANAIGETLAERGADWGWSIEYEPDDRGEMVEVAPDMNVRVFDSGTLFGASILRVNHACAWWTGQTTTRMDDDMNDANRSAIADLLNGNEELLQQFEQMVDAGNARAATAITRDASEPDAPTGFDERFAALEATVNGMAERIDAFGTSTIEVTGLAAEIEPQDIELDEAAQDAIAARVAQNADVVASSEAISSLQDSVTKMIGDLDSAIQSLTERMNNFENEAKQRLASVERADEEKLAEHDDLKPSQGPLMRVGVRPARANASQVPNAGYAALAEERLANMNTGKRNVAS